jgi:hypothetical protein
VIDLDALAQKATAVIAERLANPATIDPKTLCADCDKTWALHWGFNCDEPYRDRKFKPHLTGTFPPNLGTDPSVRARELAHAASPDVVLKLIAVARAAKRWLSAGGNPCGGAPDCGCTECKLTDAVQALESP